MLLVERMTALDFPFAVKLANTMKWNMTEEDFELNLRLEPEGCFAMFDNLKRVGIATSISYEKVGWVGNLVIDEAYRKQGGGTLLLQKVISHLKNKGAETIGLYAYQHLVGFYENVGFKSTKDFSVFQGRIRANHISNKLKKISENDVTAVIDFDMEHFGGNRKKLLELILLNKCNESYLSRHKGRIIGYIAAKRYETMVEIGPLVCERDDKGLAKSLLETILCDSENNEAFVCLPSNDKTLVQVLTETGLQESFRATRMFLGPAVSESCTYIPESLERG